MHTHVHSGKPFLMENTYYVAKVAQALDVFYELLPMAGASHSVNTLVFFRYSIFLRFERGEQTREGERERVPGPSQSFSRSFVGTFIRF